MNLLIDTNVIIGLEDAGEVNAVFADLLRKCREYGIEVFVHEASKEDVGRDKDHTRRKATLSRLKKFRELTGVATPDDDEIARRYGALAKPNDRVDAVLLHAVACDVVDFLVTEDDGLHRRALRSGLADRTFTVAEALVWIKDTYEPQHVFLPAVEEIKAYGLDQTDSIFVELRADYDGFDAWLQKCVKAHRECWTVKDGSRLAALVIRKDENRAAANTQNDGPKILKLCTFKVAADYRGRKLGEQLLKQALWFAQRNRYDLVYLTTFEKQEYLIRLFEEYGFERTKQQSNGEWFFEKAINHGILHRKSGETALVTARRHYPRFTDGADVKKFVVPITAPYHATLFPELSRLSQKLPGRPGNTIRKVYLCRSQSGEFGPGDLLFFYKTKTPGDAASQSITSVGIVENVRLSSSLAEVRHWTGKRSVFTDEQLEMMVNPRAGPIKVIDFLLVGHLETPINLATLTRERILAGWPQSITKLRPQRYPALKERVDLGFIC